MPTTGAFLFVGRRLGLGPDQVPLSRRLGEGSRDGVPTYFGSTLPVVLVTPVVPDLHIVRGVAARFGFVARDECRGR